mgnify:CR=1 FL=1
MEKQKFKSILLLALFSLAFILGGCSSNTSQGDSSNGMVVEAPASSYCKSGTHIYGPDLSIEGRLIDYNSEDGSFTTLLDNSTGAKTTRAKVSLSVTTAIPNSPEAGIK